MLPNCRLTPRTIGQMTPGDTAKAEAWTLWQDWAGQGYLAENAFVGHGAMTLECTAEGFRVDVSAVPGDYKWPRLTRSSHCRVIAVTGASCA